MSIRTRILALVGSFAIMALAVTGLGLLTIGDYNRILARFDHAYLNAWRGERLNHLVSNVVMESRGLYITRDPAEIATFVTNLNANLDQMTGLLSQWRADATPQDMVRLAPVAEEAKRFIALRRQLGQLAAGGAPDQAENLGVGSRATRIAFQAKVESLVTTTQADLDAARDATDRYSARRATEFFVTAMLGLGLMLGLALWIVSHFITRPLQMLASAIIKTSRGDHDLTLIAGKGTDEISEVWRALAVLRDHAIAAEQLAHAQREAEKQEELKLREILLD